MKKQYIAPTSRVLQLTCKMVLLAESTSITVSNEDTYEQLVKEQSDDSGKGLWDNEW